MAAAPLFYTFPMPATLAERQSANSPAVAYPQGVFYDFSVNDLVLDGSGDLIVVDGYQELGYWCAQVCLTELGATAGFPSWFGVQIEDATRLGIQTDVQKAVQSTIEAGLATTVNPQIRAVENFTFAFDGEALDVSFVVVPTVGPPVAVAVRFE